MIVPPDAQPVEPSLNVAVVGLGYWGPKVDTPLVAQRPAMALAILDQAQSVRGRRRLGKLGTRLELQAQLDIRPIDWRRRHSRQESMCWWRSRWPPPPNRLFP